VKSGALRPVVDSAMPLAEARRAHERIESRAHFGKIVLVP
jgi:NADPH:quinone reductase-like Zn-dependent oxidoreductase